MQVSSERLRLVIGSTATHVLPGYFPFVCVCIKLTNLTCYVDEKNRMSAIKSLLLYLVVRYVMTEAPIMV